MLSHELLLQESEAKLEMKILTPLQFLCGGRLPWGINKNNHIWIGRCIVAMVTALDDVDLGDHDSGFWFSVACEPIQMQFMKMVEPLS